MPPKAKRSKSPDSQFLFVNEDASTVTRTTKDAELDRTKQSHVQRQNFARKRRLREQSDPVPQEGNQSSMAQNPLVGESSTSAAQEGLSDTTSYFDILQSVDAGDPLFQSTSPPSIPPSPLDPRLSALFSDPFATTPTSPPVSAPAANVYGAQHSYRGSHHFDAPPGYNVSLPARSPSTIAGPTIPRSRVSSPPNSPHGALEQWAPPLIKHYNTVILPEKFWKDTQKISLGRFRHAPLIHADMQACMAEPAHMYAFLASAAAQMIAREGRLLLPNVAEEDTQRVPTFFKTKAIQALRAKLASGQLDHHTAVDIHRLYACNVYSDNYGGAEPHFQALLSMVEALGGLNTFDEYQLENLAMLDCAVALKRLGVPRLVVTVDPGPLPDEILSIIDSQAQHSLLPGSMLEQLTETFHECAILTESLMGLIEVVKMATCLNDRPHYVQEYYRWFGWRTLNILHTLLSLPLHYELNDKADCARIATAYWAAIVRSPQVGVRIASNSVGTLRAKIENEDLGSLWQPHTNFLLWISIFGGICCVEGEDLEWFIQLARTSATQVGVGNVRELEDCLTAFLYDPHSQRDLVLRFANKIWS